MKSKNAALVTTIIEAIDAEGKTRRFRLGEPRSVSREVLFAPGATSSNAFHLPGIHSRTVEFEGQFIGDVNRGGSCNVDLLSYVPHGLTHLETAAHILSGEANPPTVKDIPLEQLSVPEVAAVLGVAQRTVHYRQRCALEHLGELLNVSNEKEQEQ